jgi:hypothetical protein
MASLSSNLPPAAVADPANPTVVPPDVAAVRKARMNADLIAMFKRPGFADTIPSVQGIGLYTHVQGPARRPPWLHGKDVPPHPEFLPLGGPQKNQRPAGMDSDLTEDMKHAWEEIKDALQKEERTLGNKSLSRDALQKRYGALDVPTTTMQMQQAQALDQDVIMQEHIANQESPTARRRISLGDYMARGAGGGTVSTMGGAGPEGIASSSASTIRQRNVYEPSRDPRLRGR